MERQLHLRPQHDPCWLIGMIECLEFMHSFLSFKKSKYLVFYMIWYSSHIPGIASSEYATPYVTFRVQMVEGLKKVKARDT